MGAPTVRRRSYGYAMRNSGIRFQDRRGGGMARSDRFGAAAEPALRRCSRRIVIG